MVERYAVHDAWNLHEASRLALRDRLSRDDRQRLEQLSVAAADHFEGGETDAWRIEAVFHRLVGEPEWGAEVLDRLWLEWHGRHEPLQALALVLDEALRHAPLAASARGRVLITLGWIRRGVLTLEQRQRLATEALTLFEDLDHVQGQMDAHDQLGDLASESGDLALALDHYARGQRLAIDLVKGNPGETRWRRELSVMHSKVGSAYQAQGRLKPALEQYQACEAILQHLTAQDPDNSTWQRDLSLSHYWLGTVYEALGRFDEALVEYRANLAIAEALAVQDPSNAQWRRDLEDSRANYQRVMETHPNGSGDAAGNEPD